MTKKIYALLVGINNYDPQSYPPVPSLQGCVRDIEAIKEYLEERLNADEYQLVEPTEQKWVLLNQDATRQAIIEGFQNHLSNAGGDDVVLFYYSGHGAQEKAPESFWHLEPDCLNETLVCYDSRTDGSWDLADKELSYLITKVAENQPHVLVILDCCHSGSGTRAASEVTNVRSAPLDQRERSLENFVFSSEKSVVEHLLAEADQQTSHLTLPRGKHVLLAACRDHQEAKEDRGEDGQLRGVFSNFLLQALQRNNGNITYRALMRTINALVSGKVKEQSPQLEVTDPSELSSCFLGQGAIKERPSYFVLRQGRRDQRWAIDGGALHGIPKPTAGENTMLAIFPAGDEARLSNLNTPIAEAKVTKVLTNQSTIEITQGAENLSENEPYWAVITALPLERLKIYVKGEEAGLGVFCQALETAKSLYIERVTESETADYHLLSRDGQYWIVSPIDDRPLIAPVPEQPEQTFTALNASEIIRRLESIARWTNILNLPTPATSKVKPGDIEIRIDIERGYEATPDQSSLAMRASDLRLEYIYEEEEWKLPILKIKLINHSSRTLYCNILDLAENFAIGIPFFEDRSSVRIPSEGSTESELIGLEIPEKYLEQGITEYKDIFKLIVSSTEFDASLLEQDGFDLPIRGTRAIKGGFLNRLMDQVFTRQAVTIKNESEADWMTQEVTVTVVRPQDAQAIGAEQDITLQDGVAKLLRHPTLQAKANLTTVPQVRSLGKASIPAILQTDAQIFQPFQFTTNRGSDPGLRALELSDVKNADAVTPENPLRIEVSASLGEGEYLLPVASDGEFYLPLGRAKQLGNKTEIILDRLPDPQKLPELISTRSLSGSVWIFFQKVLSQKLGHKFDYPRLAVAEVAEIPAKRGEKIDYKVTYLDSQINEEKVRAEVAKAQRIVLFIHGIIGDTESMLPSLLLSKVDRAGEQQALRGLYDLVLAFDYENLNTEIEKNAKDLGERLQAIGLGTNHGKELHIVAHSMGGLVSRWFIEREGGNQIVQHLVMLGTPNAGSPWPTIQDWAFTTLGLGLNLFPSEVWPAKVIANLLDFLDKEVTKALDQMQPNSEFLKLLKSDTDLTPSVPYTIIAGDRSLRPAVIQLDSKQESPVKRLVSKLFGKVVNKVVDTVFFNEPNDIAVRLTSIKDIPSGRSSRLTILEPDAACDHLTYFTNPEGLKCLAKALFPSPMDDPKLLQGDSKSPK